MGKQQAKAEYKHFVPPAKKIDNWWKSYNFVLIRSMEQLQEVFDKANWTPKKSCISFDTETTGLDAEELELVGYSFCIDGKSTYYVPVYHFEYPKNLGEPAVEFIYQRMCEALRVFMFNVKFDARVMEYRGYRDYKQELDNKRWMFVKYDMSKVAYFDVAIPVWLGDTNIKLPSLKWASTHYLGFEMLHFDEVTAGVDNFFYLNPEDERVPFYAGSDALCTFLLVPVVLKYFKESGLAGKIDNKVLYPLMHIEHEKIWLDSDKIDSMMESVSAEIDELEKQIYETVGYQFNLNSSIQIAQVFERLGIDTGERTASGRMSTGMKKLENLPDEIRQAYPALDKLVRYKSLFKLRSAYISVLQKEAHSRGFLRGAYKTQQVPTGRLAAGKDAKNTFFSPINLQALPKPHVAMYDVFDLGDRTLFSRKDNIMFGYHFIRATYGEDGKHVVPTDSNYIGWAEGMDPRNNIRDCLSPKMFKDSGEDEFIYVACDYAAQEIRLPANMSREPVWVDAFVSGGDVHKSCYSMDTEILTKDGFKLCDEIGFDTLIAQYDPDKECVEWVPAGYKYYNESDMMYHFTGNNTDLLVTPNHRMWTRGRDNWYIHRADTLSKRKVFDTICSPVLPVESVELPEVITIDGSYHKDGFSIGLRDFVELLGYVITDGGTCHKSTGQKCVYFSQSEIKPRVLTKMQELNKRMGNLFREKVFEPKDKTMAYNGVTIHMNAPFHRFGIVHARLYDKIYELIGGPLKPDRELSSWVMNLPDDLIEVFLTAMLDGDGTPNSKKGWGGNSYSMVIPSKKLCDQVQLLFVRLGYATNVRSITYDTGTTVWHINVTKDKRIVVVNNKYTEVVKYDEPVKSFCFAVPTGLLVVRRNGKISVCGNTAIKIWGEENYNKDYRKMAKGANFSILYGAAAQSFADNPSYHMSLSEAEEFYNNYKKALPTLFQWEERLQRRGRREGYVSTYFGRPRRVKGYFDNRNFAFANRTIVNTVIQGSASDILKIVLCKVWVSLLNNPEYHDDVSFMITIHDEIGYRVRASKATKIMKMISDLMTFTLPEWPVPIMTEASAGASPGALFAFEEIKDENSPDGFYWRPKLD